MEMKFDSQYQGNECHKLNLDQYYTPYEVAEKCVLKTLEILGKENISEFFEPSAGKGVFVEALKNIIPEKEVVATDIEPKAGYIKKQDFLDYEVNLPYKKGRCFIGNPPFGARLTVAQKFWKRCIHSGDYVAWILPISQFNNNLSMYEFDLVYSEDMGLITFSGCKPVKCCFNVYRRPANAHFNKRPENDLKSVSFMRSDSNGYELFDYDFRIICWGGRCGKLLDDKEPDLAMVYKIKVNDESQKQKIKNILTTTDWSEKRPSVSCKKLSKSIIVRVLKENGVD